MSQLLHDRRLPPYYERPPVPAPMSLAPAQVNQWPQYYTEFGPQPSFTNYLPASQVTVAQPSSYASPWQNTATSGAPHFQQSAIVPRSAAVGPDPHSSTPHQSLALSDVRTSSQRAALSCSPPLVQPDTVPLYGYKPDRARSPSSHTSVSDFGTGERDDVRAWDDSSSLEDMGLPASNIGEQATAGSSVSNDEYPEDSSSGSRHSSVPVAITASYPSPSHPSVKVEPEDPDGRFVMELSAFRPQQSRQGSSSAASTSSLTTAAYNSSLLSQALAPPTEVPLRATQASKEMRRMMGVFRLNPFAMHSLSVSTNGEGDEFNGFGSPTAGAGPAPWCGGGARPLEEEPVMLEFQLDIIGLDDEGDVEDATPSSPFPSLGTKAEAELQSFSPSFQLNQDDVDLNADLRSHNERVAWAQEPGQLQSSESSEYGQDQDQDHGESWEGVAQDSRSDVAISRTTTHLGQAPWTEGVSVACLQIQSQAQQRYTQHDSSPFVPLPSPVLWDAVKEDYRCQAEGAPEGVIPVSMALKPDYRRVPKLHALTSHPYLRKGSLQNHHIMTQPSQTSPQNRLSPPVLPVQSTSALMLLNMPTHHSQLHVDHQQHVSIQDDHFPLPPYAQSPQPNHLSPVRGNPVPALANDGSTVDTFDRVSGFKQPPPSCVRHERGPQDQASSQDSRGVAHSGSIATNSVPGYPPPSDEVLMMFGPTAGVVAFASAAHARRWSLPETSVSLANVPLDNNL